MSGKLLRVDPAPRKLSIHLSRPNADFVGQRTALINGITLNPTADTRGGPPAPCDELQRPTVAINRVIERYCHLLQRSMPWLSYDAWVELVSAHKGTEKFSTGNIDFLVGGVYDTHGFESREAFLDWPVGAELAALTQVQLYFVAEVIEQFWGRPDHPGEDQDYAPAPLRRIIELVGQVPEAVCCKDDPEDADDGNWTHVEGGIWAHRDGFRMKVEAVPVADEVRFGTSVADDCGHPFLARAYRQRMVGVLNRTDQLASVPMSRQVQ